MYSIYKLTSTQTDKVYIGKTKQTLNTRFSNHKCYYKKWINSDEETQKRIKSCTAFQVLKFDDCVIHVLESNINADQSTERERYWIESTENTCNKNIPGRTVMEHYYDNHDHMKELQNTYSKTTKAKAARQAYEDANRKAINARQNQRFAIPNNRQKKRDSNNKLKHCDKCSLLISSSNMSRHKGNASGKGKRCLQAQHARARIYAFIKEKIKPDR